MVELGRVVCCCIRRVRELVGGFLPIFCSVASIVIIEWVYMSCDGCLGQTRMIH
jgi:hypothetical protein